MSEYSKSLDTNLPILPDDNESKDSTSSQKPDSKKPRRGPPFSDPPPSKQSPGSDQLMLSAVNHIPMITITQPVVSTFVPNSQMMYYVLHEMDQILITTKSFSSYLTRWTPLHSRVYYGILFYLQTMRCMVQANIAPPNIRLLLSQLEESLPFSSLPIAGPLIPFFKALSVCSPPYPEYGPVSPSLPLVPGLTKKNNQSLDPLNKVLLPNLAALYRGIANTRRQPTIPASPIPWNTNLSCADGPPVPIGSSASNEQSRDCLITPGTMYDIGMSTRLLSQYYQDPTNIPFPIISHTAEGLSWPEYLGLHANPSWFSNLAGQMQHHSKFFFGSSTLDQMSPLNGNAGLIQVFGTSNYSDSFGHRNHISPNLLFFGKADSTTVSVIPPNDKYALFTQINFVPPPNFNPLSQDTGLVEGTLFGPWWKVAPSRMYSNEYNPSLLVPTILSANYAQDKPIHNK